MHKIFVVDDEPDVINAIKKGLEKNGFSVDAFTDPEIALSNFESNKYDLLLLDIRMPKMNGFELYRKLRQKSENLQVCFFTAFEVYYEEFKKLFPTLEVKCFIRKPVTIEELVKHIKSELNLNS